LILTTIQSVVENLSKPCAFVYANLFEANGDLDIPPQSEGKDTIFVYIPPLENTDETELNPLIYTTFPLQFFLLKKLQSPTVDYKSSDVQWAIDECRDLAREFIHSLNDQDVVVKGTTINGKQMDGVDKWKVTTEYAFLDYHLFGVSVQCDVPVQEGKTGCTS
jgi:hypothetical protein